MAGNGDREGRRATSRDRVIRVLRERGPLSRADIGRHAALSRTTVSSIVGDLQSSGLLVESDAPAPRDDRSPAGRPPGLVRLDATAGAALGIDFGKSHLRVAVSDLGHRILAERRVEIEPDHPADAGIAAAAALAGEVLEDAGVERSRLVGVGMGLPGPIHHGTGRLGSSTILPGWVGLPAAEAMGERLGLPVLVDNDANLGAMAELMWGAGQGSSDMVYLKVATGIGAGLIIEGQPFRGTGGTAGEIGHTILDPDGPLCRCGNRGCLEILVGGPALLELVRPALGELGIRDLVARAVDGDPACARVVADAGTAIGTAAATVCNLFNPDRIVVGGDVASAGPVLLEPLRAAVARAAIPSAAADLEVVAGVLGERAEVLGAVALALRGADMVAHGARE